MQSSFSIYSYTKNEKQKTLLKTNIYSWVNVYSIYYTTSRNINLFHFECNVNQTLTKVLYKGIFEKCTPHTDSAGGNGGGVMRCASGRPWLLGLFTVDLPWAQAASWGTAASHTVSASELSAGRSH